MGTQRQLHAIDGFTFGAYEALPEGTPRGGVVGGRGLMIQGSSVCEYGTLEPGAGFDCGSFGIAAFSPGGVVLLWQEECVCLLLRVSL